MKPIKEIKSKENMITLPLERNKDITIEDAFELWLIKAKNQSFSPKSIQNTVSYLKMLYHFLPKNTKMRDINEETYEKVISSLREYKYSNETIYNINATFRKLIRLCYKKKFLATNILETADNLRIINKDDYRIISQKQFNALIFYFRTHSFNRKGNDNYPKYLLMFSLLYHTGIRIGECLALQYSDFEEFRDLKYFTNHSISGIFLNISKSYLSEFKLIKLPKNKKKRIIPLDNEVIELFLACKRKHIEKGGKLTDKIFPWGHTSCNIMLQKACRNLGLPLYHCHEFRHTFISNLIREHVPLSIVSKISGDKQETVLKRYSHIFEYDELIILDALKRIKNNQKNDFYD